SMTNAKKNSKWELPPPIGTALMKGLKRIVPPNALQHFMLEEEFNRVILAHSVFFSQPSLSGKFIPSTTPKYGSGLIRRRQRISAPQGCVYGIPQESQQPQQRNDKNANSGNNNSNR
ncbi:unnamed protein product, partial [Meganyctiphanes norvegica]